MSAHLSSRLVLASLAASLAGIGCDDSLKEVSLIEETRILGARVEAAGDPGQAAPDPGQHASLRLFLAATNGEPNFSYALSVCAVRPTNVGFPNCTAAPFATGMRLAPSPDEARLDFEIPFDLEPRDTPHAFATGLICADSELRTSAEGEQSCVSGAAKQLAFEFPLGGSEDSNRNPSFASDAFLLDGEPWLANAEASCDTGSLRQVSAKSLHALRVTLPETDFELLSPATAIEPSRETLLVSNFSTAGKLSDAFVSLSVDTPAEQRRVDWAAPALLDATPSLVRFYFVVRDGRSGEDFATRALCVVP